TSRVLIFFLFQCYGDHQNLLSFPTRRSSDLWKVGCQRFESRMLGIYVGGVTIFLIAPILLPMIISFSSSTRIEFPPPGFSLQWRSEEHTSELQSRENLVCRLLLEKKNIQHTY